MKMSTIEVGVFGLDVAVFPSRNDAALYFENKLDHVLESEHSWRACCFTENVEGETFYALILPPETEVHKIAHECVHLADFLMEGHGVPAENNTEIRAYLMDSAMCQILLLPDYSRHVVEL